MFFIYPTQTRFFNEKPLLTKYTSLNSLHKVVAHCAFSFGGVANLPKVQSVSSKGTQKKPAGHICGRIWAKFSQCAADFACSTCQREKV